MVRPVWPATSGNSAVNLGGTGSGGAGNGANGTGSVASVGVGSVGGMRCRGRRRDLRGRGRLLRRFLSSVPSNGNVAFSSLTTTETASLLYRSGKKRAAKELLCDQPEVYAAFKAYGIALPVAHGLATAARLPDGDKRAAIDGKCAADGIPAR